MGTRAHVCSGGTGARAGEGQREKSDPHHGHHFLPLQTPSAPHPPPRAPIAPHLPPLTPYSRHFPIAHPQRSPPAPVAPSPSPFPLARSSRTPFSPLPCLTPHAPPPIMPCVEGPPQATFNTTPRVDYASHRAPRQTTTPIVPCAAVTHLSLHFPSYPAQTPFASQSVFPIVVFPHQHLFPTKIIFFFPNSVH